MATEKLVGHFSELDHPCCAGKVEYLLMDMLVTAVSVDIAA